MRRSNRAIDPLRGHSVHAASYLDSLSSSQSRPEFDDFASVPKIELDWRHLRSRVACFFLWPPQGPQAGGSTVRLLHLHGSGLWSLTPRPLSPLGPSSGPLRSTDHRRHQQGQNSAVVSGTASTPYRSLNVFRNAMVAASPMLQHASRCIRLPPVHFAINACGGRSQGQDAQFAWLAGFASPSLKPQEGHYPPSVADGALCPLKLW